jgi:hypothetical protein
LEAKEAYLWGSEEPDYNNPIVHRVVQRGSILSIANA